jgi:hypothetical protein
MLAAVRALLSREHCGQTQLFVIFRELAADHTERLAEQGGAGNAGLSRSQPVAGTNSRIGISGKQFNRPGKTPQPMPFEMNTGNPFRDVFNPYE